MYASTTFSRLSPDSSRLRSGSSTSCANDIACRLLVSSDSAA
jgi:hypothetical protein